MREPILQVDDLHVFFNTKSNIFSRGKAATVKAVNGVSLTIYKNEIHGLVGESGSGKSTLGRAIMGLNKTTSGSIQFQQRDITNERKGPHRTKIQIVFQDPNSSLPPNMRLKEILAEPIIINKLMDKQFISQRLQELMELVDLPVAFLERYPHQLSGGQRQRIAVARAMAMEPELIIADEPTSALDVSVQAQLLNLLLDLKEKKGVSILFISHSLAVVRHLSDHISVMKHGKIIETGTVHDVFERPQEEYTKRLLAAIPQIKNYEQVETVQPSTQTEQQLVLTGGL